MNSREHYQLIVDPVSGAAGDMWLGALVDLGVPWEELQQTISSLNVDGYTLQKESIISKGIQATHVKVILDDRPQPHRHLHHVVKIIESSNLDETVKSKAIKVFTRLAESEAKVHGCAIEKVHFHEVGAVDAIIDIVGTCWGLQYLGIEEIHVLPLPLGSGTVRCAHGEMPVPAPATADLVRDFPVYLGGGQGELVTPTGAALCTTLGKPIDSKQSLEAFRIQKIGHGAGSRPAQERPNVLRLLLAERNEVVGTGTELLDQDRVEVLETTIDDMNPQWIAPLMDKLFEAGALDVQVSSVMMKKGRLGQHLTVLCPPERRTALMETLFTHSTTLGVRCRREQRFCLSRDWVTVITQYGDIRIKRGKIGEQVINIQPEYEECLAAAKEHERSLKEIYQHALAEYQVHLKANE
ncbi:nickel pincer cofactor biosynthesis protein LarC [Heliobacterium chlorum]|uniref:Pyridinium-3,5-bisthiocarboxylic acid mononucleotide nickel insertion protein n=1 Tax=Heliobacterium chlorum TaxID=2698 RepID=A0ABR7T4W9_HELCL|nr:nickel pincer cofactor biosynthesis protein LarC [Heliobacterium chlorum]MBC9785823.1 nickel pincer cofactor biosynthesis protein LarC [Heliobacterium chlorum]